MQIKKKMSQLTEKEKMILESVILKLGENSVQEIYETGNSSIFMKNLKNIREVEVENELTGETIVLHSKCIMKAFEKFKKIKLLAIGEDGLPVFLSDIMSQLSF